ncbi:MAG TPA: flagellar hook-basal body complex protein [Candidatus Ozemobacteraceae bacterium]|nr:flagellar hook-basal body complex protein [Candidatus Ozemobacteraceae bacterium]
MMRSLFTGVTGLKQHQTRMDVLSNNIANVNTTGFKRGRAMFQDLFSETLRNAQQAFGSYGGLNPMQVGLGTKLGAIDTLMEQGTTETTGKNTDLAIEGNGFFVVQGTDGNSYYTRDGNLNLNPNYDLVMANTGFAVEGWMATQNPQTGNLELNDTGTMPEKINTVKYLKKHAHQTNNIVYASNLDSGSDERDIKMGMNTLTFQDTAGNYQNLTFKFKKLDAQNWLWSAVDDTEGNVATGTIKTDQDGNVIASTVEPAGPTSSVSEPYFVYDPDGTPAPATSTTPNNAVTNTGNGTSSGVVASGNLVKDETVSIVFDGGDPTRASSFRVVGSERGFIGAGTLGGTQASIKGGAVNFGATWTSAGVSFNVTDNQLNRIASVDFPAGTYSTSQIVDTINTALKSNGLRATAFYDSVTRQFSIVSNDVGENRSLTLTGTSGDISELGFADTTMTGTGGAKPEIFADAAQATASSTEFDMLNDRWDPSGDVAFTVTDRQGNTALVTFSDQIAGNNHIYNRGEILAEINAKLAENNVSATAQFVDTNNDTVPDQLMITGSRTGSGELITLSDSQNMDQLGLSGVTVHGTAAVGAFDMGGLQFSLTEGTNAWIPNDAMTMQTTSEKGQSNAVTIYVPQPSAETLVFKSVVNGEETKITGAVNLGARHETSITVYDSLGASHELTTTWEHTNKDTKEWAYKVSYAKDDPEIVAWLKDPANGITDPDNPTEADLERANDRLLTNREGVLYFFNNGKIDAGKSIIREVECTPIGSNPLKVKLDMALATQFDSPFTTKARDQDGYEMGLLESIYFEEDGTIRGVYSNGQKQPIGQVALATFNNPGGLEKTGNNLYAFSPNSGHPVIGKPNEGDRGQILPGTLEMSNVDIAEEFTNMIVTQRAFQANSRVITTSDEILQEVVNLKR